MHLRNNLINLLKALSERNSEVGPIELTCGWFDDLYHPETELFKSKFPAEEIQELEKFHEVFSSLVESLPIEGNWENDNDWLTVSKAASKVLRTIDCANRS